MTPRIWSSPVLLAALLATGCHTQSGGLRAASPYACSRVEGVAPGDAAPADLGEPASLAEDPGGGAGTDFRKLPPPPGPERPFVVPRVEEARLANGIRVLFIERHELPIVTIDVGLDRGAAAAPPGVASLFGAMLAKGTACRGPAGIYAVIKALGAELSTSAGQDSALVSVKVLTPGLDAALELAADLSLRAALEADEIDKARPGRLTALAQRSDRPQLVLEDATAEVLYPAAHPYAIPLLGPASAIKSIGRREVVAFRDAFLQPERITIAVVGDVGRATLVPALEARFGAWKAGSPGPATAPMAAPAQSGPPRTLLIDDRGAPQSHVALVTLGPTRDAPDYAAVRVLERLLGSALYANLRQKKGYTYGVGAHFWMRRQAGPFTAGGPVVREHTADAVREMLAEIERIRGGDVQPVALDDARRQLVNENGALFETSSGAAGALLAIATNGLPLDEYQTLPARLRAVTAEDVRHVAERYLDPRKMHVVVVGDAATIRADLEALGRPAIEVRPLARSRRPPGEPEEERHD
jgi:zinc protease